jgi:succinoglycan biosynthesis transport protein ExoP
LTVQKAFLPRKMDVMSSDVAPNVSAAQVTLRDLLHIARVRRKVILGVAMLVVALVAVVVMQLTPMYTSTALVMLDQRKSSSAATDDALTDLPSDQPTIQNQVQILTSLELASRVVDHLHLDKDPEFNSTPPGIGAYLKYLNPLNWIPRRTNDEAAEHGFSPERSAIVHKVQAGLSVNPIGLSTAINVSYQSPDPYKAARIANGFANAYVEDQLEAKFQATQKTTQWLSGRIQELSKQAEDADAAVQRYKAQNHLTTPVNGVSVVDQQIRDINSQLVIAKANLAEKQANYGSLMSLQKTGQAANSAQVISSPLIATLRGQETELNRNIANLSARYLPSHPKILDLQAQKENLEQKINEEVQRIVESVHSDVEANQAHVASLQGSLSQLEGQGAGEDQSSVQLTALQSAATSARSMYEAFLGRLSQTEDREGIQDPDARIISAAEPLGQPSFPKKGLSIGVAIPAGLLLGLMIAFISERLDSGFRTTAQVEELLGLAVLAIMPEVNSRKANEIAADLVVSKPTSAFAEAVRGLKLGIQLSNVDRPPKVILVTSSVPSEGKSTLAISLARAACAGGLKTVIVDCDMRRPATFKHVYQDYQKGLVEALSDSARLEECLTKDTMSNAMILPCIGIPPSPSDLLTSRSMEHLISVLRGAYDFVLLDSPPVLPVNDAKILGRLADTALFAIRWEKTPREAAASAVRALMDAHVSVSGVAITRADSERFRYYSYGYQDYSNYTKYYSD